MVLLRGIFNDFHYISFYYEDHRYEDIYNKIPPVLPLPKGGKRGDFLKNIRLLLILGNPKHNRLNLR